MTDIEIRRAIAKLRGWRAVPLGPGVPDGWTKEGRRAINDKYLPAYEESLDAAHAAEDLVRSHWDTYFEFLISIRWRDAQPNRHPADLSPARATAHQRAEAILKTLNHWED